MKFQWKTHKSEAVHVINMLYFHVFEDSNLGLCIVGEITYTGLLGANRLASNSLLETLFFAQRAVKPSIHVVHSNGPLETMWAHPMLLVSLTDHTVKETMQENKRSEKGVAINNVGVCGDCEV